MLSSLYYYLGYEEEEIKPDSKTLICRNELLKQIKNSKLKLKPIKEKKILYQIIPSKYNNNKINNKINNKNLNDELKTHLKYKLKKKFKNV